MSFSDPGGGLYRRTLSLCPVCLRRIEARYESFGDTVFLRKACPDHGEFSTPVWVEGGNRPAFADWSQRKSPSYPKNPRTKISLGCPFDCGLCPQHAQHTCTGLIEVTKDCNMHCPVCYARAGEREREDPGLEDLEERIRRLRLLAGSCNLQISGGEPTVRDDLPDIIRIARNCHFGLLQLNTNGMRLAKEAGYAEQLAKAGLESVYLQWDGVSEETFMRLRGQKCLEFKMKALEALRRAGLGIVLVATVVKGVNDHELGDLLRFAVQQGICVRGLHVQPAAFFGRYPFDLLSSPRLTLPEVLDAFVSQASDMVSASDMHPPLCEHELCSFSAVYERREDGGLRKASSNRCCCSPEPIEAAEGARISRNFTAVHWKGEGKEKKNLQEAFSQFVAKAGLQKRFTLSAMAFQDALSLDVDRVRGCCIHVMRSNGTMLPFCLHNMTALDGTPLYGEDR